MNSVKEVIRRIIWDTIWQELDIWSEQDGNEKISLSYRHCQKIQELVEAQINPKMKRTEMTIKDARDDCLDRLENLYKKAIEKDSGLAFMIAKEIYSKKLEPLSREYIREAVERGWSNAKVNSVLASAITDEIMAIL